MPLSPEELIQARKAATSELSNEEYRAEVERIKAQLREQRGRSWWRRIFPWRIVVIRRD